MFTKVKMFFAESRLEFKRINWPTFKETQKLTVLVIGFSLGIAVFLGVWDFVFRFLLDTFFLS